MNDMTSNQPYLLRAFYDWIVDNGLTPYVVVDANKEGVDVPREFVQNGQIVLNISPSACVSLHLDLEMLSFQARFGGTPRFISMPCNAISAIYARENGAGTVFVEEQKDNADQASGADAPPEAKETTSEPADEPPRRPSGKPTLKVIK